MQNIFMVVWNLERQDLQLAEGIQSYLEGLFLKEKKDFKVVIHDIKTLGEQTYKDPCIVFNSEANNYCEFNDKTWTVPALKTMRINEPTREENKVTVFNVLNSIIKEVDTQKDEEPTKIHVEKSKLKFGDNDLCDIKITEREADHLKKIRDILGGGTMIIKKGDIELKIT